MSDHAKTLRRASLLAGAAAIEELAELRAALGWGAANGWIEETDGGYKFIPWCMPSFDAPKAKTAHEALLGAYREAQGK